MFKECKKNFCCRVRICFIGSLYTNMAWNPAEIDYFILIGNIIITVQYIQDVWMINIHTMKSL